LTILQAIPARIVGRIYRLAAGGERQQWVMLQNNGKAYIPAGMWRIAQRYEQRGGFSFAGAINSSS